jgi:hypothetical protein
MLEASRARPDLSDPGTGKRLVLSCSSKRNAPDGSDNDEAYTDGHARPRALPRTHPMPRDGFLDKAGELHKNTIFQFHFVDVVDTVDCLRIPSTGRPRPRRGNIYGRYIIYCKELRDASGSAITLARMIRNFLRAIYKEVMVLYLSKDIITSQQTYIEALCLHMLWVQYVFSTICSRSYSC